MPSYKIGFINVCGLSSKLNIPDFVDFIEKYDIIALAETRLYSYDNVNIKGYTVYPGGKVDASAFSSRRVKHGGVCLLIKNDLVRLVSEINIETTKHYDGILWCIIGNILFGVMYIPPSRSVNLDEDIFDRIQNDIVNIQNEYEHVNSTCLLGDFNGRTGLDPDYTLYDDYVIKEIDDKVQNDILLHNSTDTLGCRISQDLIVNEQGRKVLGICNSMNLRIVNGRFGPSSSSFTCKGSSVVDYALLSPSLFSEVLNFKIDHFDPIISDVHKSITLDFHCTIFVNRLSNNYDTISENNNSCVLSGEKLETRVKWNANKANNFRENISNEFITELNNKLDKLLVENVTVNPIDVDTITVQVSSMFVDRAKSCDMLYKPIGSEAKLNPKKVVAKNKWFNVKCKDARRRYNKAKRT